MSKTVLDTARLRSVIRKELESRRLSDAPGDYAYNRDNNDSPLYGVTGAANLYAELGFDFGSFADRQAWVDRINSFQEEDGTFCAVSGPEHGAAMAILALNILGGKPARPVAHLAPLDVEKLDAWLNAMEWEQSTHKEFGCGVAPLLASGFCTQEWITTLQATVENRLNTAEPQKIWTPPGETMNWRVISCIYHVLSGYDAGRLPYPQPRMIWDRLMALDYPRTRNDQQRTFCTDFDYAALLQRLCYQLPEHFDLLIRLCSMVLDKMIVQWEDEQEKVLKATTHELYCYCIGWALYHTILPERFTGPPVLDTLNAPALYRLPSIEWVQGN